MNLDTMSDLMTTRCLTDRTLKKSFFSPARPWRAETRLSPGFVLGSSRKPQRRPGRLTTRRRAQTWCSLSEPCAQRGVLARRGWVGEMSELFEHPPGRFLLSWHAYRLQTLRVPRSLFRTS